MPKRKVASQEAWVKAYDAIKHRILSMEMKPGQIVSENKLSQQLGISRTPIREALKHLELDGLIVASKRRKRVFVLTIHEVEEIFELKIAIEGEIARLAVEKGEQQDFDALREVVQSMSRFADIVPEDTFEVPEWIDEWLALDRRFHALLFQMADNKRAEQIIKNLNYQWHRLKVGLLAMEGRIQKSVREHTQIAQAMLDDDAAQAETLMKEHLANLRKVIITIMSTFHFPMDSEHPFVNS
ncbi:FCD domain-containing protein [candidate division KSB3 bacterium]|uniref:FCD domain-containing protein n=1 Tax=candidate division KSB3 bacterium TaxID=2044937 RepID=A0A9D5JXE8_9BACT|nr:FCD domain-containing protein [candidate division KSB3 bacterium]MBD3325923.1 FCD domain-containing protein [candidate division KSB3 bacterium]